MTYKLRFKVARILHSMCVAGKPEGECSSETRCDRGIAVGITVLASGSAWLSNIALGYWIAVPAELPALPTGERQSEPATVAGRGAVQRVRSKRQLVDGILARNILTIRPSARLSAEP